MSLNSLQFIIYFFILLFLLFVIEYVEKVTHISFWKRIQILLLLLFSYLFILKADWRFCLCIFVATILTYFLGIVISQSTKKQSKQLLLLIGIASLIAMLAYFKYTDFFLDSFSELFGCSKITLHIILPIGISFYTFSALSYLIDVFRDKYKPIRNMIDFSLYIAFFPKLTAGPIIRGSDFFPQVMNYRGLNTKFFSEGIQIFVFGLFQKMVLADRLGVFVNDVFHAPSAFNTGTVLLAIISYSLQIYFDFSGYSTMAIGISKIIGFDFKPNFNLPYIANGMSDFWRRWHISLSSWFMEYLYFPLGGNRKGKARTYVNLMIVMLISGLWHGAGFTFIIWGLLHGLACCLEKLLKDKNILIPQGINILITTSLVTFLWVPFRSKTLADAIDVFQAAFTPHTGISQPYTWTFVALSCLLGAIIMAYLHSKKLNSVDKNGKLEVHGYYPILNLNNFISLVTFFTFCGLTIILGYYGDTSFIYGNF